MGISSNDLCANVELWKSKLIMAEIAEHFKCALGALSEVYVHNLKKKTKYGLTFLD